VLVLVSLFLNGFLSAVLGMLVLGVLVGVRVDAAVGVAMLVLVLDMLVRVGVHGPAMIVLVGMLFAFDRFCFHDFVFIATS